MAKQCRVCGKKLSIFRMDDICSGCNKTVKREKKEMGVEVLQSGHLQDKHVELLKKMDKGDALILYNKLYEKFHADKGLDDPEIETLLKLQSAASLSNDEIKYTDKLLPYIYASAIKNEGKLPTPELVLSDGGTIILKKDEAAHFANAATLKEKRSVTVGYVGGSRGASVRIMKGFYYRAGAYKGHVLREDRMVATSRGLLVLTNKRLLLAPAPGCKALSIPLEKIFSISGYENGLELGIEGRTKSCFFVMSSGAVEIFSMCINHILGR